MDPCLPNPCRNGGSCKSHLKEIKELHLHEAPIGSLVHGTDESVVTVVGPEESDEDSLDDDEGFHLPDKYDDHFHHISPHHFHEHGAHGTSYFGLEHGEVVDHGHLYEVEPGEDDHDHEETISYLTNVHSRPIRVHHYQESSADFDDDTDRHIDPPHHGSHLGIQDEVYGMNDENRHHSDSQPHTGRRRDKGMNRLNEDTVTKITKNVVKAVLEETKKEGFSKRSNVTKTKTNKIRKRTLQDLYVCECLPGFLGAHCQRMCF